MPNLSSPRPLAAGPALIARLLHGLKNALRDLPDFCHGQVLLHDAHYLDMLGDGITAQLADIHCKTLVVSAELATVYPPSDYRHIAQHIAGAEHVIIASAGHAVVAERPATVSTLMTGHLLSMT